MIAGPPRGGGESATRVGLGHVKDTSGCAGIAVRAGANSATQGLPAKRLLHTIEVGKRLDDCACPPLGHRMGCCRHGEGAAGAGGPRSGAVDGQI